MNNHLFLFTLGPVQSFISQARKTRDLYAGSQILSDLVKAALDAFKERFPDGKVIFPDVAPDDSQPSYPNRFVARVSAASAKELEERGKAVEQAVRQRWKEMAEEALKDKNIRLEGVLRRQFDAQIDDILDIYWLFTPMDEDYAESYHRLERLGGAIKNIRPFKQLVEQGMKCSLDGRYNAIFHSSDNKRTAQGIKKKSLKYLLSETEGLSAVSFVKRTYPGVERFPSTSHVALMNDISALEEEDKLRLKYFRDLFRKEKVIETCIAMFQEGLIDKAQVTNPEERAEWYTSQDPDYHHFLFEENLTSDRIKDGAQLELLQSLQQKLKEKLKTRYYAMLMFDGDQMGKWLSGDYLKEDVDLEVFHSELSKLLATFARKARAYLNQEKNNGQTVYAGGDDFLGLVNIYRLFDVVAFLRKTFHREVSEKLQGYKKESVHLTFSAGIVIAHYKTPYSEVLKKTREAEKKAKNEGNRNAFCIAVMKHSGEIQEAVYKWYADSDSPDGLSNWEAIRHIFEKLGSRIEGRESMFSNTFIQNLTREIETLMGIDMQNPSGAELMGKSEELLIFAEIKRLVARSWNVQNAKDEEGKEKIQAMSKQVKRLYSHHPKGLKYRPRNFVHVLHIADFLTRKTTGTI